jgi:hypothetical protein
VDLTEAEMIEILEEIAQSPSNRSAQIAAIKELRSISRDVKPADESVGLYEVSNPGRIRKKSV